jgi:hypothetical protein
MLNEILFGVMREERRGATYCRNNIKNIVEGKSKRFLVLKRNICGPFLTL